MDLASSVLEVGGPPRPLRMRSGKRIAARLIEPLAALLWSHPERSAEGCARTHKGSRRGKAPELPGGSRISGAVYGEADAEGGGKAGATGVAGGRNGPLVSWEQRDWRTRKMPAVGVTSGADRKHGDSSIRPALQRSESLPMAPTPRLRSGSQVADSKRRQAVTPG